MSEFDQALCVGLSDQLWFPPAFDEEPTGTDGEYWEIGKMVCSVCVHQKDCQLRGADEKYGMWGGTTPPERRRGVTRPSKRLMNQEAFDLLNEFAQPGVKVDIKPLRDKIREVTRKRAAVPTG